VAPIHLRGRYIGAMQTVFGLANAIGPVLGLAIWAAAGTAVFGWAAAIAALSTLCALIGMRLPGVAPSAVKEPVPEATG
jgi:MFS family permease